MSNLEHDTKSIDRQNALNDSKNAEFYSQGVAAWFNSALEHDKSILTLSVAGVGFLVSVMQTAIDSAASLVVFVSAILFFMVCIISVLLIFKQNKKHVVDVVGGVTKNDRWLEILDSCATYSFFTAMLLSALLGISSAITTYSDKGKKMANENTVKEFENLSFGNESFSRMADLQRSFQGMDKLQPQPQGTPQGQPTQATTQTQTTQAQNNQSAATVGGKK